MSGAIFALRDIQTWGFGDFLIAIVIIAACFGIAYLALQYFEVTIPPVIIKIFWITVVAIVAIIGIRFVLSL